MTDEWWVSDDLEFPAPQMPLDGVLVLNFALK